MTIGNMEMEFPIVTEPLSLHTPARKRQSPGVEKGHAKKVQQKSSGRSTRLFHERIRLLTRVYENKGVWPAAPKLAPSTKRYYRTNFPEFFADPEDREAAQKRKDQQEKAAQQQAKKPRKSRAKKDAPA